MSWSIVAAVAGVLAVIVTIIYGEITRRLAQRELVLTQRELSHALEQAELRPKLEVALPERHFHYQCPIPIPEGYARDGHLLFEIRNVGGTVAHHIDCTFEFDTEHLDTLSSVAFGVTRLPPFYPHTMQVNLRPRTHGLSKASYTCTYDEGLPVTGT